MDPKELSSKLVSLLLPYLPALTGAAGQDAPAGASRDRFLLGFARLFWEKISPEVNTRPALQESLTATVEFSEDEDAISSLRFHVARLVESKPALSKSLLKIWKELESAGLASSVPVNYGHWAELLGRGNLAIRHLEMIRLFRSGLEPERIARQFDIQVAELYKLNAAYSLGGMAALLGPVNFTNWLESLDPDDPLLRRLEMVRLHKRGTPAGVIAAQYHALPDYIEMVTKQFDEHGVAGIFTEEDFQKFRDLRPERVRICTFNLHGPHTDGSYRLLRIAKALSGFQPDVLALQEVIAGADSEDTSSQVAGFLSSMTGCHYRGEFAYCHQFGETYPEGIALVARHPLTRVNSIDLTRDLGEGLAPLLARNAQVGEIEVHGRRLIAACVHLDHTSNGKVRVAQIEKLLRELHALSTDRSASGIVVAGDFNDSEDSPAIGLLKSAGYKDAYRFCHRAKGNTFPLPNPTERIDYIMVKGDLEILSSGLMLNDPELSDHAGVFVVLR
jgi:maltose 6'-phosphate phosphatase